MLNFNRDLKGLDGNPIIDASTGESTKIGKILAGQLASAQKGDALKMFAWALKLHAGEELDLDKSDESTLKTFIKENEFMTVLLKAQLLEVFKD